MHEVLADAIAAVGVELGAKVVAHAAGGDFDDQFGSAVDVPFGGEGSAAAMRAEDIEACIGLRIVVQVEGDGAVISDLNARRR